MVPIWRPSLRRQSEAIAAMKLLAEHAKYYSRGIRADWTVPEAAAGQWPRSESLASGCYCGSNKRLSFSSNFRQRESGLQVKLRTQMSYYIYIYMKYAIVRLILNISHDF
jgi:hypothetical protein